MQRSPYLIEEEKRLSTRSDSASFGDYVRRGRLISGCTLQTPNRTLPSQFLAATMQLRWRGLRPQGRIRRPPRTTQNRRYGLVQISLLGIQYI